MNLQHKSLHSLSFSNISCTGFASSATEKMEKDKRRFVLIGLEGGNIDEQ
jgi:hypothetical protein